MLQRRVSIAGPICFALPSLSIRRLAEAIADRYGITPFTEGVFDASFCILAAAVGGVF
ncbi:hypothetical protein [Hyphomicrobium sulfonivorans]|uniref:hypothetical protein n=1 Tax=Hyphomicrobium sulfonivorans TaxID=121290 RepID=UPI001570D4F1|nr:hypothetical protein [Hyphomicrobium sulfonivorans]MBI1649080.1 hypothetical protein [Hyphomicrobium sulfonivorans]